jgi:hypothetical protein
VSATHLTDELRAGTWKLVVVRRLRRRLSPTHAHLLREFLYSNFSHTSAAPRDADDDTAAAAATTEAAGAPENAEAGTAAQPPTCNCLMASSGGWRSTSFERLHCSELMVRAFELLGLLASTGDPRSYAATASNGVIFKPPMLYRPSPKAEQRYSGASLGASSVEATNSSGRQSCQRCGECSPTHSDRSSSSGVVTSSCRDVNTAGARSTKEKREDGRPSTLEREGEGRGQQHGGKKNGSARRQHGTHVGVHGVDVDDVAELAFRSPLASPPGTPRHDRAVHRSMTL